MTMLVSTLSTLCFSWICTNLYFCSHIKSRLRKSGSAITSFLIYSMDMLMPPRSVLWTAVLSASVRFCPHYSPVFFQEDTSFQKPVTLAAILYTSLAFLKRDFLFSSLLIFDLWEAKKILVKSIHLGIRCGSPFWIWHCLPLRILTNHLASLNPAFIICKSEITIPPLHSSWEFQQQLLSLTLLLKMAHFIANRYYEIFSSALNTHWVLQRGLEVIRSSNNIVWKITMI